MSERDTVPKEYITVSLLQDLSKTNPEMSAQLFDKYINLCLKHKELEHNLFDASMEIKQLKSQLDFIDKLAHFMH